MKLLTEVKGLLWRIVIRLNGGTMGETTSRVILRWCTPISNLVYTNLKFGVHQFSAASKIIVRQCTLISSSV